MSLVTLFEHANYQGKSASINSYGNYRDMASIGFTGNTLSSLKVAPSVIVELYDFTGFRGAVRRFCGPVDIPFLKDFNDKTNSIRVLPTSSPQSQNVHLEALPPQPPDDIATPNLDASPQSSPNVQGPSQGSTGSMGIMIIIIIVIILIILGIVFFRS